MQNRAEERHPTYSFWAGEKSKSAEHAPELAGNAVIAKHPGRLLQINSSPAAEQSTPGAGTEGTNGLGI